jgi:hypothetical protein
MQDNAGRCTTAAVFPAVDRATVPLRIAPGKQHLQERMQRRQGRIAPDKHTTPDERADAAQDDPQLVDAERCGRDKHALRVAQRIVPLKGCPPVFGALLFVAEQRTAPHADVTRWRPSRG